MSRIHARGEAVRRHILEMLERHPADIAKVTAAKFGISRQAVNKHLQRLAAEGAIAQHGKTRSRTYKPAPLARWVKHYPSLRTLEEDRVWGSDVAPSLGQIPQNVRQIWNYGFSEILNNAIDHSEGTMAVITFEKTATTTTISIQDDGVGIFKKIQASLGLADERHAVLELAKGKLTTDPAHHTGEGIFFASRMFDDFQILSGGVYFSHAFADNEDWIMEQNKLASGTGVWMKLGNHTARTTRKIFDQFSSGEDYGFTKTVVPVRLARYGDEQLVSRSQAKRLLARVEKFQTVILDFREVASIGQAFADEAFRVFPAQHPKISLVELNATSEVKRMISRARSGAT